MRLPRFTTRRLIGITVVAVILVSAKLVADRWWEINGERKMLAMDHTGLFGKYEEEAERARTPQDKAKALALAAYHFRIREKLIRYAERPWLSVPPDPRPPE
jgi:hypothetical protein